MFPASPKIAKERPEARARAAEVDGHVEHNMRPKRSKRAWYLGIQNLDAIVPKMFFQLLEEKGADCTRTSSRELTRVSNVGF